MSDLDATHVGLVSKAVVRILLKNYVVMFTGRTTATEYGELLNCNDHPDASKWLKQGLGTPPGMGLLVLEIQDRVLKFLIKCCQDILPDMDPERVAGEEHPIQPNFQPPSENDSGDFSSMFVMSMEARYRPPVSLDWQRLDSLLWAKKAAAEDHI